MATKTIARKTHVKTGVRHVALVGVNPARKANPRPEIVEELEWLVRVLNTEKKWVTIAGFMLMRDANLWGQAYADRYPKKTVSIQQADWA